MRRRDFPVKFIGSKNLFDKKMFVVLCDKSYNKKVWFMLYLFGGEIEGCQTQEI